MQAKGKANFQPRAKLGRFYLGCACHTLVREGRDPSRARPAYHGTRKGPQVKPTPTQPTDTPHAPSRTRH
ncbi:hypothetical protein GCM10022247_68850 [Allokutzneria multivorans]|uniref:Uncharacterized protein n=1 Tax=Allokutzneria multivorans TaxID=1142134 RepID=A0ABP7U0P5_9PSEU